MNIVDGTCKECGVAIRMFLDGQRICGSCVGFNPMVIKKVVVINPCNGVNCKCNYKSETLS